MIALGFSASPAASAAPTSDGRMLVGLLEEVPGIYVGEKAHFGVRVAFERDHGGWRAFPFECSNPKCLASVTTQYPRETWWTVSSSGRILGTVLARTPGAFGFYSQIGIQNVADGEKVPHLRKKSVEYSGFADSPMQKPLLATTGALKLGPAHGGWKLSPADPQDAKRVWPYFQRLVPLIDSCRFGAHGDPIASDGRAPKRAEFEIATTWTNRAGEALLHARVRQSAFKGCDGPLSYRSAYWYFRQSDGAVWLLPGQDSRAELLMPLDFMDMLGDGSDEALFLMTGYDAGGYALFYDGFRKVSAFRWIYH
jgi:hypothetical protein